VILLTGCSTAPGRKVFVPEGREARVMLRVSVAEQRNAIRVVPLEEYVAGSVISEVAPPTGDEAIIEQLLEVQAVVARTYALANRNRHRSQGFDLCSTTHCQLYQPSRLATSRWADAGRTATVRTAGDVLWYGQRPASTLFHADCGGHTSSSAQIGGGVSRPYLPARPDDDLEGDVHATWRFDTPLKELRQALNASPRMAVGSRLDTVEVLDRDVSGRAETIALRGQRERLVRGEDFRAQLTKAFGARSIRSTLFSVKRERDTLVFEGKGFGHGVGLCQAGALARIKAGATPRAVLERYFPQTIVRALSN
jgi:stage II sporulation protein D